MKQQGIALVQVLIISIVLATLALFIQTTVQQQVASAAQVKNAFALKLELEQAQTDLFVTLLTENMYRTAQSDNPIVKRWNFYSEPFKLSDNVTVSIQDKASLINLNFTPDGLFSRALERLGVSEINRRKIQDSLEDWKDEDDLKRLYGQEKSDISPRKFGVPRNAYLQSEQELRYVAGANELPPEILERYFTTELITYFNPRNAPEYLLQIFTNDDKLARRIAAERKSRPLTTSEFTKVSGINTSEYISFATSGRLRIELKAQSQGISLTKKFDVRFQPRHPYRAVIITNSRWNQG